MSVRFLLILSGLPGVMYGMKYFTEKDVLKKECDKYTRYIVGKNQERIEITQWNTADPDPSTPLIVGYKLSKGTSYKLTADSVANWFNILKKLSEQQNRK